MLRELPPYQVLRVVDFISGRKRTRKARKGEDQLALKQASRRQRLAVAHRNQTIGVYEVRSNRTLATWKLGADIVRFDASGKRLLLAKDSLVRVIDVDSGEKLREIPTPQVVQSAAWSPNGKLIATGTTDKLARIWEVETTFPMCNPDAK